MVAGESNVGLLLSLWSNESVDLLDIDFVKFLACSLDHWLACSFVNDEYKCVVVLNGLDGRLTTQWVLDNSELIEGGNLVHSSQKNLWLSDLSHGLWESESSFGPHLSLLSDVSTLLNSGRYLLSDLLSLGLLNHKYLQLDLILRASHLPWLVLPLFPI